MPSGHPRPKMHGVIDLATLRTLLAPFQVSLSEHQAQQVQAYLDLLLRWNHKINLTAITRPEECVTRHFGETLCLVRCTELGGSLLDIGSGAGFPGLVLKLANPSLAVTLLEPVAKKRAFLKEVARVCELGSVVVLGDRLEDFARTLPAPCFDLATARAVGDLHRLIPEAFRCLTPQGRLCLWLGHSQAETLTRSAPAVRWQDPLPIPLSQEREIWVGTRSDT